MSLLAPPPRPPHDPTSIVLGAGRFGWRAAALDDAAVDARDGTLALRVVAGARALDEASGSLGGVTPPRWVALDGDGGILLLDRAPRRLRRFDPCTCAFADLPCLGGPGAGPRELADPRAIAIAHGDLFVADPGNARVTVVALRGLVLRGHLHAPPGATWQPVAVAAEPCGTVLVADPATGALHRFAPDGRRLERFTGLGAIDRVAVDPTGRIHVGRAGGADLVVLAPDGRRLGRVADVAELAGRFPGLPFAVDADGVLRMPCGTFDAAGAPLGDRPPEPVRHAALGRYVSEPLDSGIDGCRWHRVTLRGSVPPGTSVEVWTATAETPEALAGLDPADDRWSTGVVADDASEDWDCLVAGERGRWLVLRLDLRSRGTATPRLAEAEVELPRIGLLGHLPAAFREDPAGDEFPARFLSLFDTTLRSIERSVDGEAALFDPRSAPATAPPGRPDMLSWLAGWIGVSLERSWPEARRRRFLAGAGRIGPRRGTVGGLRDAVLLYLGIDAGCWAPPVVLEHFRLRRWLFVGAGRLGDEAVLWSRRIANRSQLDANAQADVSQLVSVPDPLHDPFRVLASRFSVFVPARLARDDGERGGLERLLRAEAPAHAEGQLVLVEPRLRIGVQSVIGFDAVVGRYPSGVRLGGTALGRDGVLTGTPPERGPHFGVGTRARIGSGTRLD